MNGGRMKKTCIVCGKTFECKGRNVRCTECQKKYRKEYVKKYNKFYRIGKPPSAISQYYQFYKFANSLTDDGIRFLYARRIELLKHCKDGVKWKEYRTQMKILLDIYKLRKNKREEERIVYYGVSN